MKKKKLTLQEKLDKRKVKQPLVLGHWFYHFVFKYFYQKRAYNAEIRIKDDIRKCKSGCFLIFNHLSRLDHIFVNLATYPRRFNMLAGHNEFFRSHLHWAFKAQRIIPKKIYSTDLYSIKAMRKIIKMGGVVAFAPEGTSSIFGNNQPIVPGTGHFLKHFNVPVYFLKTEGAYLTQHKINNDVRKGKITAELSLLFTPEDLKSMQKEEIEDKINEAFKHDDYEWNKVHKIKFETKGNAGSHYHDILYKCPRCGEEFSMIGEKDYIKCNHCGNGAFIDDYYNLIPFDNNCVIPESPTKWSDWERIEIIKAIRKDPNYEFKVKVKLGYLPPYHYVKDKKTSEICGEGEYIVDHKGIHFRGTKLGEPFNIDEDYNVIYTPAIPTTVEFWTHYLKNGDYYEFFPDFPCTGKVIQLIQEMHRLHVNFFKNFKWNDYMYENLEENESK